jgi:hypothetical protein
MNRIFKVFFIIALLSALSCRNANQQQYVWHDKNNLSDIPVPVSIDLSNRNGNFAITHGDSIYPIQQDGDSGWVILNPGMISNAPELTLQRANNRNKRHDISLEQTDSILTLSIRNQPVLTYVTGLANVPGRSDSIYARNGFIHPLWSPNGAVLTAIHPQDHLHHLGLWHPWTKAVFRGHEIDFWNLGDKKGTVRFTKMIKIDKGPVFTGFTAEHIFYQIKDESQLIPVINENFTVRLWNIPEINGYLIDYNYTQKCATEDSVQLPQYRYGGFGFRGTEEWHNENRIYLSSEGNDLYSADGARARWCIVGGETAEGLSSVLFMSHPSNHEYPEPIRIWGDFSDQVFFNFCPIKKHAWTFYPGKTYHFRYRIYVCDTILNKEKADLLWQAYAESRYLEPKN